MVKLPPELPLSQPVVPDTPPPRNPLGRWRRWLLVIVIGLIVLTGLGYGASLIIGNKSTPAATPTPSSAPAVSTSERSKVADKTLEPTTADVTNLIAQNADLGTVIAKALQVTGDVSLQVNLTVGGNGTFGGNIQAANFVGNGSQLTGVDASLLNGQPGSYYAGLAQSVSGLSANAALRNAPNTFTASNTFNGGLTVGSPASLTGSVTISGPASLTGTTTISSLILGSPLTATQGGTGLTSVPVASVLYGQGGPTLGVATPVSAGLCLISGATDVQWGSCSGGAAVASLDGLTGVLTLANSSGAGSTVTIDNATTAAKGIASFNATNFSVSSGAVNTIQNIATTSSPTFAGLTLTAPLTVANGGTGAGSLSANGVVIGQGTGALTTVTGAAGQCLVATAGVPSFQTCPGSGGVVSLDGLTGTLTVSNTTAAGSTITIDDATAAAKGIASFNSTNFSVSAGAVNTVQNINTTASPTFTAVNTNTITPSSSLTVGAPGQAFTLQGNSSSTITARSGGNTTALIFQTPTANVNFRFVSAAAGTYDVCTTASNCVGLGGGVSTPGGTINTLPKFTGVQTLGDSLVTDDGALVTVGGNLSVTGTVALTSALTVPNGGTGANALTANGVIIGHGTSALTSVTGTNGQCLMATAGAPAFQSCPGGGGVLTLNGLSGALSINNASGAGSAITIDDATTAAKGIASFNASNFSVSSGAVNTIQNIGTGATPTFAGVNTNTITPSGAFTAGATTQGFTLQGNATSTITATNAGNTTSLTFQSPTANVTYRLATAAAGSYDICTTVGNCAGSGGGVSTSGGTTNRLAKFTGTQVIDNSTISDDGTNVTTSVDLIVQGGDLTLGVANSQTGALAFKHSGSANIGTIVQGALTGGRTYTLPDASGTFCLTSGNCSGTGSANTLQAAYDAGNAITTTDARNLSLTLADTTTDANFAIGIASGSSGFMSIARADGSGTADPAQLLLLDNLDTDRLQPIGLKIQSAAGGLTTAVDLSDPEIVDAINVGANNLVGTTGNLDFTNFDVIGSSGNTNIGGTLDASGATVLHSTLAVTANTTLTGDIAVNGGDITSTGALNITPTGALTLGSSTQPFTTQGTSASTIKGTNGANTTTLAFTTPTANTTLNLPALSAGTYDLCTSSGNCAGVGVTLQAAYGNGSTITTTDARDLAVTLADTTTDSNFTITVADNSTSTVKIIRPNGSGTNNPAQLLLLDNQDTNQAIATGIVVQSAGGSINTGVDLSDPELVNAVSVGDNVILGAAATIDFSSFDVAANGNIVTAGDLAVNGGDITTTGTLNVTPGGSLTVGATGQAFTLQGNASSTVTATSGGSTTALVFQTPTANVNYRFATAAAGTYDVCTTAGNCTGGAVTLQNAYDNSSTPADITLANGKNLTITAADTATDPSVFINLQCTISCSTNGRFAIQSGGTDVLKVSPNGGAVLLQNASNSAAAFEVRDQAGTSVPLSVNTSNSRVGIGAAVSGSGATLTVSGGTQFGGSGLTVFTTPANSTNLNVKVSIPTYTVGASGATVLALGLDSGSDSTSRGILVADRRGWNGSSYVATPHQASVAVLSPDESDLLGFSWEGLNATGYLKTEGSSIAIREGSKDIAQFLNNYNVGIGATGGGISARLTVADGNPPSSTTTGNGSNATEIMKVNGGKGQTTTGTSGQTGGVGGIIELFSGDGGDAPSGSTNGSGGAITIQGGAPGSGAGTAGNYGNIFLAPTGGKVGIGVSTSATMAADLTFGTGTSRSIAVATASSGNDGNNLTIQAGNGNGTNRNGGTLLLQGGNRTGTGTAGGVTVKPQADLVTAFQVQNAGASSTVLDVDTTNGRVGIGNNAPTRTLDITGAALVKVTGDALEVQDSGGLSELLVDTSNDRVYIGNRSADTVGALLVVDHKTNSGDPTGVNGGMYYNENSNKFRCYENSSWKDCLSGFNTVTKATDQAATQSSTTLQSDNTLTFPAATNTSYVFTAWIPVDDSNASADLKYSFATPAGSTLNIMSTRYASATTNTICNITASATPCSETGVNIANLFIKVEGYVVTAGTSGTVDFQFAQDTSTAASFPVVKTGATLSWHSN